MLKFIGIVLALMPIVLFLRAIFMRSKKTSQAVSEFKKQLDYAVWLILFFIGCAVVYSVGKLIYLHWLSARPVRLTAHSLAVNCGASRPFLNLSEMLFSISGRWVSQDAIADRHTKMKQGR